jgi:hypothetical protein
VTSLDSFEERWNGKYAAIGKLWWRHWAGISPQFAYPDDIRRAIYTTNVVESLHMTLRKVIRTRASFPNEESALKLLYLALRNWRPAPKLTHGVESFPAAMGDRMGSCDHHQCFAEVVLHRSRRMCQRHEYFLVLQRRAAHIIFHHRVAAVKRVFGRKV